MMAKLGPGLESWHSKDIDSGRDMVKIMVAPGSTATCMLESVTYTNDTETAKLNLYVRR